MPENNLQNLAFKLARGEKTEENKIEKLYCFVKEEIKYKLTVIGNPEEILERGYGSCFDKSLLFAELLKTIGVANRYHIISVDWSLVSKEFFIVKFTPSYLKPPFYPHVFNEIYLGDRWEKIDTSLDSEIEKYFLEKKFISGRKECCIPKEYILEDGGCLNNFSDIFTAPSILQLENWAVSHKKETQLGLDLFNRFLYQKRKNKIKRLKEKEPIGDILVNINKLKK